MARQTSIGDLAYHNLCTIDEHINIRYNKIKAGQFGGKIKDKHIYANPFNPLVCPICSRK